MILTLPKRVLFITILLIVVTTSLNAQRCEKKSLHQKSGLQIMIFRHKQHILNWLLETQ